MNEPYESIQLDPPTMTLDELRSLEKYCVKEAAKLQRVAAKIRKEIKQRKRLQSLEKKL